MRILKIILLSGVVLLFMQSVSAQEKNEADNKLTIATKSVVEYGEIKIGENVMRYKKGEEVYRSSFVDEEIKYPGGYDEFYKDFQSRFIIPKEILDWPDFAIGMFITVEKDGSLSRLSIYRDTYDDPGDEAEREGLRVLREMPIRWQPAIMGGEKVRCTESFSIRFVKTNQKGFLVNEKAGSNDSELHYQILAYYDQGFYAFKQLFLENYKKVHKNDMKGQRIEISFIVELDGTLSQVKVLDGSSQKSDKNAVKIVKSLGKWKPGKQDNMEVRSRYRMVISDEV